MKSKLYTLTIAGLSILFFSCKTASKLYEKGNYDEAVEIAAKKLQKKPDDAKLIAILQSAYSFAVNDHESSIRNLSQSNDVLKWEKIYYEYASLQKMYTAIYNSPAVFNIVKPADYSSYLGTYAEKAGDVRFERGIAFMQAYSKQNYKNAYYEFQASLRLQPGRIDAIQKRDEAYDYAVTNVIVLPMQQHGGFVYSSYTLGGNNFDDQLIRNLQYGSSNEFVKFYSAWDARSSNIRVDQELEMRLSTVDIGRYHDNRTHRRVSKDIVVKETVYRPDSVVREYAKVVADITTTRRSINSFATLQVNVRDENGRWVWADNFNSDHNWYTEFSSYTGDARALSESDKQLVGTRADFAPSENEIMRCLLEKLQNDAQYRVKNYFMRY
jgi:predicted chitinase